MVKAALLAVIALSLAGCENYEFGPAELNTFSTADSVRQYLADPAGAEPLFEQFVRHALGEGATNFRGNVGATWPSDTTMSAVGGCDGSDLQPATTPESGRFKADGMHLYMLTEPGLSIIQAVPAGDMKTVGLYPLAPQSWPYPDAIHLAADKVVVLCGLTAGSASPYAV